MDANYMLVAEREWMGSYFSGVSVESLKVEVKCTRCGKMMKVEVNVMKLESDGALKSCCCGDDFDVRVTGGDNKHIVAFLAIGDNFEITKKDIHDDEVVWKAAVNGDGEGFLFKTKNKEWNKGLKLERKNKKVFIPNPPKGAMVVGEGSRPRFVMKDVLVQKEASPETLEFLKSYELYIAQEENKRRAALEVAVADDVKKEDEENEDEDEYEYEYEDEVADDSPTRHDSSSSKGTSEDDYTKRYNTSDDEDAVEDQPEYDEVEEDAAGEEEEDIGAGVQKEEEDIGAGFQQEKEKEKEKEKEEKSVFGLCIKEGWEILLSRQWRHLQQLSAPKVYGCCEAKE